MLKKPVLHQEFEFVMIEELVPEKLWLPSVLWEDDLSGILEEIL